MKQSMRNQQLLLKLFVFTMAVGVPGCDWSFLGCKNSTSSQTCGQLHTITLNKTITVSDPSFFLETPYASSSSSCPASFSLDFQYADAANALHLNDLSKVPINLSNAFQVRASDGTGGTFAQGTEWNIQALRGPNTFPQEWFISFDDHNSATAFNSKYTITFGLNSTNPIDSMKISGSISYHDPN